MEVADFHGVDIPTMTKCDVDELRFGKRCTQVALMSQFNHAPMNSEPSFTVFL